MNIYKAGFSAPTLARRKKGLFVYRFCLILAKFEAPAAPQKIAQSA